MISKNNIPYPTEIEIHKNDVIVRRQKDPEGYLSDDSSYEKEMISNFLSAGDDFEGLESEGYTKITELTYASFSRLAFLGNNLPVSMPSMITLTFGAYCPRSGGVLKYNLDKFRNWLKYQFRKFFPEQELFYLWVLEFQDRGVPHFHIITNIDFGKREIKRFKKKKKSGGFYWSQYSTDKEFEFKISRYWSKTVYKDLLKNPNDYYCFLDDKTRRGSNYIDSEGFFRKEEDRILFEGFKDDHRKAGVRFEYEKRDLGRYIVKYTSKREQKSLPLIYRGGLGRWWGCSYSLNRKIEESKKVYRITPELYTYILSKLGHVPARRRVFGYGGRKYSFCMFCKPFPKDKPYRVLYNLAFHFRNNEGLLKKYQVELEKEKEKYYPSEGSKQRAQDRVDAYINRIRGFKSGKYGYDSDCYFLPDEQLENIEFRKKFSLSSHIGFENDFDFWVDLLSGALSVSDVSFLKKRCPGLWQKWLEEYDLYELYEEQDLDHELEESAFPY
jgi:hypothetical protein